MPERCKEQAQKIITSRGLCSYMNRTKWRELITAIRAEMPVPPPYQFKFLTSSGEPEMPGKLYHWGNWNDEGFPTEEFYFNIEWLRILPICSIPGKQIDEAAALEAILARYHIPYERDQNCYTIYGYK